DPRGQGGADVLGDPDRRQHRHADPGHVPEEPGGPWSGYPGSGARKGQGVGRHLTDMKRAQEGVPDEEIMEIEKLLRLMVEKGTSDLYITADVAPSMTVHVRILQA